MKQYVIIGGGVAAVSCIEGIREIDTESHIVLISGEARPAYCRPLISYYLEGKTDLEKMKYRPDSFYSENDCEIIYAKAVSLDTVAHEAVLDDGQRVYYDAVCVATGSSPFVPRMEGLDTVDKKFSFQSCDDALELEKALLPGSRVLIVGAGLIGLKCAEGISEICSSITVCDLAPRVLSSILDDTAAALMQKSLEDHGVRFFLGDTVARFDGNSAVMKSGVTIDFDVLVLAVGVRANVSLVSDAGGKIGRGIVVDGHMKTTLDGIYAAGDCAELPDASSGEYRVMAIMPNATLGGRCAGVNMAGGEMEFDNAIPMNAIGFFGLHALTAGTYDGDLYEEAGEGTLKRLYTKNGYLSGFMLIGNTDRAGIYTSLIRNKIPLDTTDFETLKKVPLLNAFPPEYRQKKMAGWHI